MRRPSLAQYERQVRQAQQAEEIQSLADKLRSMLDVHEEYFPPAERPIVATPKPIDPGPIRRSLRKDHLKGIPLHRFRERKQARSQADLAASAEVQRQAEIAAEEGAQEQRELDAHWQLLTENDPASVIGALEASFADNEVSAAPVNCEDGRATILLLMEPEEAMPDRRPSVTPTGRPTLKKFNQTERSQLYQAWLSSNLLATVKEGFAVAPALDAITAVVFRWDRSNPFDEPELDALYVGTFARERFDKLNFRSPEALNAIYYADDVRLETRGQSKKLVPLNLKRDKDLAELVSSVKAALSARSTE